MSASLQKALAYIEKHDARFVEEIAAWCRIPSVSSQAEHKPDMQRAAEWTAARLRRAGLQNVAILPTAGHPVVYGEWLGAGRGSRRCWSTATTTCSRLDGRCGGAVRSSLSLRGEYLFARGATTKGQTMANIKAREAHICGRQACP